MISAESLDVHDVRCPHSLSAKGEVLLGKHGALLVRACVGVCAHWRTLLAFSNCNSRLICLFHFNLQGGVPHRDDAAQLRSLRLYPIESIPGVAPDDISVLCDTTDCGTSYVADDDAASALLLCAKAAISGRVCGGVPENRCSWCAYCMFVSASRVFLVSCLLPTL